MTSKTAALGLARRRVSSPIRRSSTDYLVVGPYRDSDPHGPHTEVQRSTYPAALDVMTGWRAKVAACAVLGRPLTDDECEAGDFVTGAVADRLRAILGASTAEGAR